MPGTSLLSQLLLSDIADLNDWLQEPAFAQYCMDVQHNIEECMASHLAV